VQRNNQLLWRTRTQVGRADRQTPLLASSIVRLTLNPTWPHQACTDRQP
jgi:murein L,D-transpeptidase YcbB/YkuD